MKYKSIKDNEIIVYDVFIDKDSLEEIKNNIIKRKLCKINDLYSNLINIIEEIINEEEKGIDNIIKQISNKEELNVSFFKNEIKTREKQILLAEKELKNNISIDSVNILKTTILRNKEQLDIYKIIDDSLKQEYYNYLQKIFDCVKLNPINVKKKSKKIK